ncbi:MAG TPA: 4-hydroxybenzoate 3-monooxygenase [Actinomycetes bacterium]|nr:4-hydroxybenzoate 3-monooxygenase [Actinomycetes bacterium]
MRTQVGIVGAGPAGLTLAHLLHLQGIESVVLEARSREYVEHRVRAGVLEQGTVDLLTAAGVGDRLHREGMVHHGLELRFGGRGHRIPLTDLTGRSITIYGQQEVVKDLIAARLQAGGTILFEVEDVRLDGVDGDRPVVRFRAGGAEQRLDCDVVAGCDGFHGVCRDAIPGGVLTAYGRDWPYAWLGVLAEVAPSTEELIYCSHERGFALHSMRSPRITRLYLQVGPTEPLDDWPDERIWQELQTRLATDDGWRLQSGPILEKGVTALRSYVVEPMQHGRLYLAGDAAHIVPATGAKGLNLAVNDVRLLAEALAAWYRSGSTELLDGYSAACLRRVWRVQDFSSWMTLMLHRAPTDDDFERKLQRARLEYVASSEAAARGLAENYVGLERV